MQVHKSTPLTVEDRGTTRMSGGAIWHKWFVRFVDGSQGLTWTPDQDEKGSQFPPPFTVGKHCAFIVIEAEGKETKIRPFDVAEFDREERITRMACVNSAAALGASFDNFKDYADSIYEWVTRTK